MRSTLALSALVALLAGCSTEASSSQESHVTVDTRTELAWAQHQENLRFAEDYVPRCLPATDRPRVLVTGFGRFKSNRQNASGLVVSELSSELSYPLTDPPPAGAIDPPGPQTAVARDVLELARSGQIELCAMVLPVFWDLAAVLVLAEIEAFEPDFVVMNGIRSARQRLWFELGAVNEAQATEDGSNVLEPIEDGGPLLLEAPEEEHARAQLLSWQSVRSATEDAITLLAALEDERGVAFGEAMPGVSFAGYPRSSNTYLCNNLTYVVGYLMDHPGEAVELMRASHPVEGAAAGIAVELPGYHAQVPRLFVHWPRDLRDDHLAAGAEVLSALVDAQIHALVNGGELPTRGDNAFADIEPN
jgi:pyrrolidone-carboxylate peptidase